MNISGIKYKRFLYALLLVVAGCEKPHTSITLSFDLEPLENVATEVSFYVHDLYLINSEGQRKALILEAGPWQNETVALLHLANKVNGSQNKQLLGYVQAQDQFTALEFKLGVPFTLNHNFPLRAETPLNNSSMFWSWQQGYKFLRIDVGSNTNDGGDSWSFHLGSTGCYSASSVRPPAEPCRQANITSVHLPLNPGTSQSINNIQVSLASLAMISAAQENLICTGNYKQTESCSLMLREIGLNAETGACENSCRNQTLFKIKPD